MGAIMSLETGNDLDLAYRPFERVTEPRYQPEYLMHNGQQRLTSLYLATSCDKPVNTTTERGEQTERFYYLDVNI